MREAPSLSAQSTGLSIFVVASILLGRRFAPRFPVSLVVVVGTIAASAWFHLSEHGIAVIGPVPGGLPSLKLPDLSWRETLDLLPVAGVMLRHDHRTKRRDVARIRDDLQRTR